MSKEIDRIKSGYIVVTMKVSIVKIGNSRGIRLPKAIIEQCKLDQEVDLEVKDQKLIITPAKNVRAGWKDAFEQMSDFGDDESVLKQELSNDWDDKEWEWR